MVKLERDGEGGGRQEGSHETLSKWLNVVPVWDGRLFFIYVILTFHYLSFSLFLPILSDSTGEEQGQRQAFPSTLRHSLHVWGAGILEKEAHWQEGERVWHSALLFFLYTFFFSMWVSVFCLELLSKFTKQTLNISTLFIEPQMIYIWGKQNGKAQDIDILWTVDAFTHKYVHTRAVCNTYSPQYCISIFIY